MRQLIIARKDLGMSAGKLAAQVSHASLAFLTSELREYGSVDKVYEEGKVVGYVPKTVIEKEIYEEWICGIFTKTVCEAKNKSHLLKVVEKAKEMGMEEGKDFFLIFDACLTELKPEMVDENGVGRTLTCISFKPLPDEISKELSRKYQLYK